MPQLRKGTSVPASHRAVAAAPLGRVATGIFVPIALLIAIFTFGTGTAQAAIDADSVAVGTYHSCAVTDSGAVKCWGSNSYGQVGDGSTTNRTAPVDVVGLGSGISQVTAGMYHTCALSTAGAVKCWGYGFYGQLGDGDYNHKSSPVSVVGLSSGVESISAGAYHTCAVLDTGGVKCWGHAAFGQVGDGGVGQRLTPVDVSGLASGVAKISAGGYHTCVVLDTTDVKCWGRGVDGQIGDGSNTSDLTPVAVSGLPVGATEVAAGLRHTCALDTAGFVQCWGRGNEGQLGQGAGTSSNLPVATGFEATSVSSGLSHTCATTDSSAIASIYCWGAGTYGQLGVGYATASLNVPSPVVGLPADAASSVAAGGYHTCGLTSTSGVVCWGYRNHGQLGTGSTTDQLSPVGVIGLTPGPNGLDLGGKHSCAVDDDDTTKCWGSNGFGQMGSNSVGAGSDVPAISNDLVDDTASISAGAKHSCAVTLSGAAKCFGDNINGQLGDGTTTGAIVPVGVTGLGTGVEKVLAGDYHSCALTTTGGVKCWGSGTVGSLGNGSNSHSTVPVDVTGLTSGVTDISVGGRHSCAVTTAGGVKCWGYNANGQLGDGSVTNSNVPVDATGLASGVAKIAAGGHHSCAVTTGGAAKCWGYNRFGSLGIGSVTSSAVPMAVVGMTSQTATIAAGNLHTCATRVNGVLLCWGDNRNGQLGIGTYNKHSKATRVIGFQSGGATSVALGESHTCAVTTSDAAKCWGNGANGRLGYGSTNTQSTPVTVLGFEGI